MRITKPSLVATLWLLAALPARANLFEVRNYAGTIGGRPVQVSLQWLPEAPDSPQTEIRGVYYYERYRGPIKLVGRIDQSGDMSLSELTGSTIIEDFVAGRGEVAARIGLHIESDQAYGYWHSAAGGARSRSTCMKPAALMIMAGSMRSYPSKSPRPRPIGTGTISSASTVSSGSALTHPRRPSSGSES